MILAYHFSDFGLSEQMIEAMRDDLYEDGPDFFIPLRLFYSGLVYLARFKESRRWKYKRKIRRVLRQFKKWENQGAINCRFMSLLLSAELQSLSSPSEQVVLHSFDEAIDSVGPLHLPHYEALANELAFDYLHRRSDLIQAGQYLSRAMALYKVWGATAKLDQLRSRYDDLLNKELQDPSRTAKEDPTDFDQAY